MAAFFRSPGGYQAVALRILLPLLAAVPLSGQARSRVAGHIARVTGRDTVPVGGVAVVLHRVGRDSQGPVDTVVADRNGRFRFRFVPDSSAAYLLSARYGGIEYFSQPVATNAATPDTGVTVFVADTSSTAPVSVRQRTLLIGAPDAEGSRTVLDWFVLSNAGTLTRIAPDTLHASWGTAIPSDAQNVELADSRLSQFAPDALVFRRDSVLVFAPVSPGDKELMLQYRIPGTVGQFTLPPLAVRDSVFILLEEAAGRVGSPGFAPADSQVIEGRSFHRWAGAPSGVEALDILLPVPWLSTGQTLWLMVGGAGLLFAGFGWLLLRHRGSSRSEAPLYPMTFIDAAARLDSQYLGKEADTPPEEWASYLAERARLKESLQRALATGPGRS